MRDKDSEATSKAITADPPLDTVIILNTSYLLLV